MARLVALRALKLDDTDPEIYYGLGLVFLEEKQPDKAWVQLEKAVSSRQDFLPARVALAKLSLQRENYLSAENNLKSILALDPKSAEAHLNLGVAYKGLGQFDKAMQEYDAAEKLNPDLAAIYLNRGIILHRHKDAPDRGLEFYKKYVALSGGEVALPVESSVFSLIKEAEGLVQMKQETARQEAEAKKLEELQKLQEQKLKQAEEEEKKKGGTPPSDVQPAKGQPGAQPVQAKGKVSAPPPEKKGAAPEKSAPPAPKANPAPPASDEPEDAK
jgi:Tfp pilus assembly protein PilF